MRILIITAQLGLSPGGKVCESIIRGLSNLGNEQLIICSENHITPIKNTEILIFPIKYELPHRLSKLIQIVFRKNLRLFYWDLKVKRKSRKTIEKFNPSLIFSIAGGGSESILNIGKSIARLKNKPFACHLFDPIPGPSGWENFEIYRKSRIYAVKNALKFTNLISMGNSAMLLFQQANLDFDIMGKSYILPDPVSQRIQILPDVPYVNIILYVGTFYAARKPDSLLNGFSEYHKIDPDAELHIVGVKDLKLNDFDISESAKNKIQILEWTLDLNSIYNNSTILVDVDADIPDDVYISSKLKNYLPLNRIILSISRTNSPARKLLHEVNESVIFSQHDGIEIAKALEVAIGKKSMKDILKDREAVLKLLAIDNVVSNVNAHFEKLITN